MDGEPLDPATVFPDICCKRELLSLACVCPFKNRGCSWQGEMRDFNVRIERELLFRFLSDLPGGRNFVQELTASVKFPAKLRRRGNQSRCFSLRTETLAIRASLTSVCSFSCSQLMNVHCEVVSVSLAFSQMYQRCSACLRHLPLIAVLFIRYISLQFVWFSFSLVRLLLKTLSTKSTHNHTYPRPTCPLTQPTT